jgi:hypothetical protein
MRAKLLLIPGIVLILMTGACAIPEVDRSIQEDKSQKKWTFTAVSEESPTKTAFQADETSIWWSPSDEIAIFYGASEGSKFTATNDKEVAKAEFQGELETFTGESESGEMYYFWAVYPYSSAVSCDGQSVVVRLSDQQEAKAGSFAPNTNISIAKSPGLALSFYNACAWFRFTVKKEGVKRVVFRGNGNEDVAGEFRISMGEDNRPTAPVVIDGKKEISLTMPGNADFEVGKMYYITLLPQMFQYGFTVYFQTDTEAGARSINTKATYLRSKYNTGTEFDKTVEYIQEDYNIGDIVYSDGWGVVSSVTEDGELLLISVTETTANWSTAKTWCESYGQSWTLPTINDLSLVGANFDTINASLEKNWYTKLADGYNDKYWSSTFYSNKNGTYYYRVWCYQSSNGNEAVNKQAYTRAAKWVSKFEIRPTIPVRPIPIQEYNLSLTLQDNTGYFKTQWEKGDEVYIFLRGLKSTQSEKKYLKLIHDGTRFNVQPNDIDVRELLSISTEDKKLTAIYHPISGSQVTCDDFYYRIRDKEGNRIASYYFFGEDNYQFDGTTLTAQVEMVKSGNNIKIYIGGIDDPDRYKLSVFNSVGPEYVEKIDKRELKLSQNNSFTAMVPLSGIPSENGLVFTGYIDLDAQTKNYHHIFVLYDTKENKVYTIARKYCLGENRDLTLPSNPASTWAQIEDGKWMDMGTAHKWCFFDYGALSQVSLSEWYIYRLLETGEPYLWTEARDLYNGGVSIATVEDWEELKEKSSGKITSIRLQSDVYGYMIKTNLESEAFLFLRGTFDKSNGALYCNRWIPSSDYYCMSFTPGANEWGWTPVGCNFGVGFYNSQSRFTTKYSVRCVKPD